MCFLRCAQRNRQTKRRTRPGRPKRPTRLSPGVHSRPAGHTPATTPLSTANQSQEPLSPRARIETPKRPITDRPPGARRNPCADTGASKNPAAWTGFKKKRIRTGPTNRNSSRRRQSPLHLGLAPLWNLHRRAGHGHTPNAPSRIPRSAVSTIGSLFRFTSGSSVPNAPSKMPKSAVSTRPSLL